MKGFCYIRGSQVSSVPLPQAKESAEVGFRVIFYPTKQRSVLEKLTRRIPAMQSQRETPSAPDLFSDIAVAIQLMVKAAAAEKGVSVNLACCVALHSTVAPGRDHQLQGPGWHPGTHRAVAAEAVGESLWTLKLRG